MNLVSNCLAPCVPVCLFPSAPGAWLQNYINAPCLSICRLLACIKLCKLQEALSAASALATADSWKQLGLAAMQLLDVQLAIASFRQVRFELTQKHGQRRLCRSLVSYIMLCLYCTVSTIGSEVDMEMCCANLHSAAHDCRWHQ